MKIYFFKYWFYSFYQKYRGHRASDARYLFALLQLKAIPFFSSVECIRIDQLIIPTIRYRYTFYLNFECNYVTNNCKITMKIWSIQKYIICAPFKKCSNLKFNTKKGSPALS